MFYIKAITKHKRTVEFFTDDKSIFSMLTMLDSDDYIIQYNIAEGCKILSPVDMDLDPKKSPKWVT